MTETMTGNQIEDWKTELALAMEEQQWRRALQLCSWLRYAAREQDRSDPKVEEMHSRAKDALAKEVAEQRAQRARQEEHRRLRLSITQQSASGAWMKALDSIEVFYQNGASQEETLDLLQALRLRLSDRLFPAYWHSDPKALAMTRRYKALSDQVRSDS